MRVLAFAVVATVLAIVAAWAAPPANSTGEYADWYRSLSITVERADGTSTTYPCCSIADCRPTEYRVVGDGYEVFIHRGYPGWTEDKWVRVPPERMAAHKENPTGRAVACWTPNMGLMCFVKPAET